MLLESIKSEIIIKYDWISSIFIEDGDLVIEEEYYMGSNEKNDDDCCDTARENGEMIIESFPMLEISNYYCHRHKYAIVELKLKELA